MRYILLVSLMVFSVMVNASRQLTTYTIHYAEPTQILRVVQGYLSAGSSASLYQNQLVVNASAAELAKTTELIRQLDVKGRQLQISVKSREDSQQQQRDIGANGKVFVGNSPGNTGIQTQTRTTVTVKDYQSNRRGSGNQGVRATEGQPAYVSTGSSAPITNYRSTVNGQVIRQQDYVSADTGFYATAWVNDNSVRVTIDQRREQFEGRNIQSQQLQTAVSGALGVWIPIGIIGSDSQINSSGIAQRGTKSSLSNDTIYIKVELLE